MVPGYFRALAAAISQAQMQRIHVSPNFKSFSPDVIVCKIKIAKIAALQDWFTELKWNYGINKKQGWKRPIVATLFETEC